MSNVKIAFGIASLDEQVCSNFKPFSYSLGSAISFLRTVPYGANTSPIGLRSGLPAPLNRLDRSRRPAPLPGPAAHLSLMRAPGRRAGDQTPAVLRQLIRKQKLRRPPIPLASDKRHIRFSQHYRCLPDAPRSSRPDFLDRWPHRPRSPTRHGIETGAKRPKLEQVR